MSIRVKDLLVESVGLLIWVIPIVLIVWLVGRWISTPNTTNPFLSSANKVQDFHLKATITEDTHSYIEPVIVHTDPCSGFIGSSKAESEQDGLCLSTTQLTRINWPNGGYSTFKGCNVSGFSPDSTVCEASNGSHETYGVVLIGPNVK